MGLISSFSDHQAFRQARAKACCHPAPGMTTQQVLTAELCRGGRSGGLDDDASDSDPDAQEAEASGSLPPQAQPAQPGKILVESILGWRHGPAGLVSLILYMLKAVLLSGSMSDSCNWHAVGTRTAVDAHGSRCKGWVPEASSTRSRPSAAEIVPKRTGVSRCLLLTAMTLRMLAQLACTGSGLHRSV